MKRFVRNFAALDATEPYDVCIVGAGVAGTVLAVELVRAGLHVLLVESSSSPSGGVERPSSSYETSGSAGRRAQPAGSRIDKSHDWHGVCERLDPADFRAHPYNRQSNPWPICYADLEPHYRAAERAFRVRQAPPTPGRHLPRSAHKDADQAFAALLRRHGIDAKGAAHATPGDGEKTARPAPGAAHATPGAGRAVVSPSRELLPEFVAARTGTLVSGVTVTRLRTDGHGRVIGAVCRTADGVGKTARAQTYVVAAGALETPRLLLLSRSQRFPLGVGNDFDRVGRGFTDQAVIAAQGSIAYLGRRSSCPAPLHTEQFHQILRRVVEDQPNARVAEDVE